MGFSRFVFGCATGSKTGPELGKSLVRAGVLIWGLMTNSAGLIASRSASLALPVAMFVLTWFDLVASSLAILLGSSALAHLVTPQKSNTTKQNPAAPITRISPYGAGNLSRRI
ncbi:hypothetical protein J8F10_22490 [Gemmata sp. G18]|uniref:Uncharacterized protein n=1 Tax=Gemmata palustris TaxID=2822762 RepID=A0ABS5BWE7_9BACT|nr:hypothetical protein [Gemmata palustris]MBP3958034.1 hypothetical protein [Gemmata palustris]